MTTPGSSTIKIETRLIDERFESVMGECDLETIVAPSIFKGSFCRLDTVSAIGWGLFIMNP